MDHKVNENMKERPKKRNKTQERGLKCCCETDDDVDDRPPLDEEDVPDVDLEMDTEDAIVQAVDGVLVDGDDEEVRMLFYHHKIGGLDLEDDTIRCKAVAEFRVSRKAFSAIANNFSRGAKGLKKKQKAMDRSSGRGSVSMFA
jgi:hypothetical protein